MKIILSIFCAFFFIHESGADLKTALFQKAQKRANARKILDTRNSLEKSEVEIFNQLVDHFPSARKKTVPAHFAQRYWVNSDFVKIENKETAPVFYVICGEAPCDGPEGMAAIDKIAEKLGAHRVALEHRYYGE